MNRMIRPLSYVQCLPERFLFCLHIFLADVNIGHVYQSYFMSSLREKCLLFKSTWLTSEFFLSPDCCQCCSCLCAPDISADYVYLSEGCVVHVFHTGVSSVYVNLNDLNIVHGFLTHVSIGMIP
jgi:hypothetical protein